MASTETVNDYDLEILVAFGKSLRIGRASVMRKDTLIDRMEKVYQDNSETDLLSALKEYISELNNNNKNHNNDQSQSDSQQSDSSEQSSPRPMRLIIKLEGYDVETGEPVSAPTMKEFVKSLKNCPMEKIVDEDEEVHIYYLKHKIARMKQPFDAKNNVKYVIKSMTYEGKRFEFSIFCVFAYSYEHSIIIIFTNIYQ